MSAPDQNPPVDPAALAAAAETKVLPRDADPMANPLAWILESAEARNSDPKARTVTMKFSRLTLEMWMERARAALAAAPIEPVPHTKGRDKATCPHCDMNIEAAEVRDYQVLKGWAAGCDTKGCPGERDERKVSPRKATAIAAASAVWPTPQAPMGTPKPGTLEEVLDLIECAGGTMQDAVCAAGDKNQIISYLDSAHDILSGLMSGKAPEGSSPKAPADLDTTGCDHDPECITMYEDGRLGQIQCSECEAPMEAVHSGEQAATRHELIALRAQVSTLTDALTKARGVIAKWNDDNTDGADYLAVIALMSLLESPALAKLTNGGAA